jgi:hypothetical protein
MARIRIYTHMHDSRRRRHEDVDDYGEFAISSDAVQPAQSSYSQHGGAADREESVKRLIESLQLAAVPARVIAGAGWRRHNVASTR